MAEKLFVLSGYLKSHDLKQQVVADLLGKTLTTANRKIRGKIPFTVKEIKLLHDQLGIPIDVFFKD
ncbi:helix-turn-helix domain-containing protein [Latilactobacillus graminis]|uniref:Transcriptional regulator n=1 Tax=Latilactobacillus graminis TaxID=60519 RepID=A0ABX6C5C3_9LACO|nr:helix-turn-helix domain-containing protein [Latilactobacillus graminis]QFP78776.1 transcriptional regulator [Latilactobacillus graminis]